MLPGTSFPPAVGDRVRTFFFVICSDLIFDNQVRDLSSEILYYDLTGVSPLKSHQCMLTK